MAFDQKTIAREQIWKYLAQEQAIDQQINSVIGDRSDVAYKIVDSLFLETPSAWTSPAVIVTDNIPTSRVPVGRVIGLFPEYWHVYHYEPKYQNRPPQWSYNCFMNRVSPDRAEVFHLLKDQNILDQGLVSFNCLRPGNNSPTQDDIDCYGTPYNNLNDSLEQCIIDSNIGLVMETYNSQDHVVFSEKIFRALQMPRPWMLWCGQGSVAQLRNHGFDVLDDYVDHCYDNETTHSDRITSMIDQLKTFVDKKYNAQDFERFDQAASYNRNLLLTFAQAWPSKFDNILKSLKQQ
jgi:hypothetical protein